jgi:cobaltochelatase CobS
VACDETLKHHIPKSDPNYHFQPITADVVLDAKEGAPVMLTGHTGTGKTSMITEIAAQIGQPLLRANMNGQTSPADFTGFWSVKGAETVWVDGILPYAMRHGLWLVVDELDFAESTILSVLNAVLEKGTPLLLSEKGGEVVQPHENFRIFATTNTAGQMSEFRGLYQGTNLLNEAFLDRWRCYLVDYMPENLEAKVLQSVSGISEGMAPMLVKVAAMCRKSFTEETLQSSFSTRRLMDWSRMIVRHRRLGEKAALKAAESTIYAKVSKEDAETIKGVIIRVCGIQPDSQ